MDRETESTPHATRMVRVTPDDAEWVRRVAFERRVPQHVVMHEAIELYRTTPEWSTVEVEG